MSYMESFTEKPAIIIDIGRAYTKCGFAGESGPHLIIPTRIFQNDSINIYDYKRSISSSMESSEYLKETLNEFLYRIYYKILNANSRERKIVIVESVFTSSQFRACLAHVLFKNFQAISVAFVSSHLASLYTLGINTSLVIDCGYTDCQIMPIAGGMQLIGLCDFVDLGAKRLHTEIDHMIRKHAYVTVANTKRKFSELEPPVQLTEDIIEDIKIRCCFVTSFARSRQIAKELEEKKASDYLELEFKFAPDCDYNLVDNMILNIPGYLRETLLEILFIDKNQEQQTIPNLILNTIARCPIDLRKEMTSNILIIGGTSMLNGFKHRLASELDALIKSDENLAFKTIGFHAPPSHDNYTAWLGASIFGALETLDSFSIANSKYNPLDLPDSFNILSKNA